ncbi:MAG TPA: uracil-DNA glycosylase [Deltaproteobacteria bacterium]|nr:uracil-DNA glycosylase [Deltaproteobacteria bacterium]
MRGKGTPISGKEARPIKANCLVCRHFFITHHPRFPYGCRAARFKSRLLPSQEMQRNSGLPCQFFEEKDREH